MSYFDKDEILARTNNGLDIILWIYPQAQDVVGKPSRKFKIRENEKTPSATLRQQKDGNWVVTDFGSDSTPRNGILLVMHEKQCDFKEALDRIASHFNIESREGNLAKPIEAQFSIRPAEDGEVPGEWSFKHKEGFTDFELQTIFASNVIKTFDKDGTDAARTRLVGVLSRYGCTAIESYTIIKDGKALTWSSTDEYPIFHFSRGKFSKVYQPLNADKSKKFLYTGQYDKNYINGLVQCEKAFEELQQQEANKAEAADLEDDEKPSESTIKHLPEIIICSGERDALNVAALGYQVVWFNSETYKLHDSQYKKLLKLTKKVYYLGDIDITGRREAHRVGYEFLDIHLIKLPKELANKRDGRGKPCKDVRDFFEHYPAPIWEFGELLKAALPYRFWNQVPEYTKDGKFKRMKYEVDNVCMFNFLAGCGFGRLRSIKTQEDMIVRVEGNIVTRKKARDARDFINLELERRFTGDRDLRNTFYRSAQLNDTSILNLPIIELDFTSCDQDSQYLFFINGTWKVTKNGIEEIKPGGFERYIWEDKVIKHRVKRLNPFFEVYHDSIRDRVDIKLPEKEKRPILLQYLYNTCRMHWKIEENGIEEELPNGTKVWRNQLTDHEAWEERMHLINRLYTLGYMMHRYKDPSRTWAVWALENKITEEEESKGGSGKSIFITIPKHFLNAVYINGRDSKATDNKHLLEKVTENTDYCYIDDADRHLNFGYFYPMITGPWDINPKNTSSFTLEPEEAPKLAFSSNFPPKNTDQSTERRLLYTVFSDYYHTGGNDEFEHTRTPLDDFGKNLFKDFTEDEWEESINLVAQCIQFYMSWPEKLNGPMDNVAKRSLKNIMGDAFQNWADVFFSDQDGGQRDTPISRHEAHERCKEELNQKMLSSHLFMKKLEAWCKFYGYQLNPQEYWTGNSNRILGKDSQGKSIEMIFVKTKTNKSANLLSPATQQPSPAVNPQLDEDVPF